MSQTVLLTVALLVSQQALDNNRDQLLVAVQPHVCSDIEYRGICNRISCNSNGTLIVFHQLCGSWWRSIRNQTACTKCYTRMSPMAPLTLHASLVEPPCSATCESSIATDDVMMICPTNETAAGAPLPSGGDGARVTASEVDNATTAQPADWPFGH